MIKDKHKLEDLIFNKEKERVSLKTILLKITDKKILKEILINKETNKILKIGMLRKLN